MQEDCCVQFLYASRKTAIMSSGSAGYIQIQSLRVEVGREGWKGWQEGRSQSSWDKVTCRREARRESPWENGLHQDGLPGLYLSPVCSACGTLSQLVAAVISQQQLSRLCGEDEMS